MDTAQFDEFKKLLAETEERLRTELRADLGTEMKELMKGSESRLRTEFKELIGGSESRLRAEFKELIGGSESRLRKEMRQGFSEIRQEMAGGFQSVRSEMTVGFAAVADSFEDLSDMIEDQHNETSLRLSKLEKQSL